MTNAEKLDMAIKLLWEVSDNWNEDEVEFYPRDLDSFDEEVNRLGSIVLK